jgi:uncharacterized protein YaiE (UPF0345 family)
MGIGLQGTDLSIEFVNDAVSANVPTRIYANPLILLGGNIGIGTTSPTSISGYGGLTINGTNGAYTYWNINGTDTGRIITDSTNMYFDNVSTGALVFRTTSGSTERMRITSAGDVGIGTSSPRNKLDVSGSIFVAGGSQIQITNNSGATGLQLIGQDSDISLVGTMSAQALVFRTDSTERMRITSGGSVLLGTTTDVNNVRLQVAASGGVGSWISGTFAGPGGTDKVVLGNLAGYTGASIGAHNSALSAWAQLNINPGGGAVYAGTLRIDNNSDQRFKRNITGVNK